MLITAAIIAEIRLFCYLVRLPLLCQHWTELLQTECEP